MKLLDKEMEKTGKLLCKFYRIHDNETCNEEELIAKLIPIADEIYQRPLGEAEDYITIMGDFGKLKYDMDISYVYEYSALCREKNKDYYKDMHWLPKLKKD